jgi:putative FmdB family regulatory protein
MPLYSFVCSVCGAHFEEKRSFKDADGPAICPNGHASVHRQYLAPAVVFKGSGWYSTDHRKADTRKDG